MMKALNDLCDEVLTLETSYYIMRFPYQDRSVPSPCQIASLQVSLIFPYFSLLVQLLRNLYLVYQKNDTQKKYIVPSYAAYETVSQMYPRRKIPGLSKN